MGICSSSGFDGGDAGAGTAYVVPPGMVATFWPATLVPGPTPPFSRDAARFADPADAGNAHAADADA